MAPENPQRSPGAIWDLIARQHGVLTRRQLLELGLSHEAVRHRIAKGRLHPVWPSVYAVGRPHLTRQGRWMAAVLSCGEKAVLSHTTAAALWGLRPAQRAALEVSVPARVVRVREGIVVHRRSRLHVEEVTRRAGIPVTTPVVTLVDIAAGIGEDPLEQAVNEADRRGLADPEALRAALDEMPSRPGVARLRRMLDRRTFTLTESHLERLFLPLARRAGLPPPVTGCRLNGFKVDFHWPDLGLVVETDGLRYHRTPAQQATDRLRDQAHTAAGLVALRFTHAQVRYEPRHVETTLRSVARHITSRVDGR